MDEQAQMDRIRIRLDVGHETMWMTKFDQAGCPTVTYPVNPQDVATAFIKFGVNTGFLALDTLFWQNNAGEIRIGIYTPPQPRKIRLIAGRRAETLYVPLPGFVFVGQGRDYWIWAVMQRPLTIRDPMFVAPLPNVHDDGVVCFGNVKVPICKPDTIGAAMELFFSSDFNFHLVEGKIKGEDGTGEGDLIAFLRQMSKRGGVDGRLDFPIVMLVHPTPTLKMGDIVKGQL